MKNKGFTLIEVVISVSIFAVLFFVATNMMVSVFQNPQNEITSIDNIDQAKGVASTFVNELRAASVGNDGSYDLNQTADNQIIFYSNLGCAGTVVNRIRYYLSGNTLYKGVTIPTGSPLSYNLSSEIVTPVITALSNGSAPAFYYYDGTYNGSGNTLSQPVNISQVRYVQINLLVKNQISNNDKSVFPITAGSTIRNLKDNLGN